jgi:hypothetical protein
MFSDQRRQPGDRTVVLAAAQVSVDLQLECGQADLVEVRAFGAQELWREVGQGRSAPQPERRLEPTRRALGRAVGQAAPGLVEELLEPFNIQLARLKPDPVGTSAAFDSLRSEQAPYAMDVYVQRPSGGPRRSLTPQRFDQFLAGGKTASPEQQ